VYSCSVSSGDRNDMRREVKKMTTDAVGALELIPAEFDESSLGLEPCTFWSCGISCTITCGDTCKITG
jgi:hypothetical protein